ncbi:D-aminoacyl-tRNA deacylase [Hydrogenophaga sp. 5NK40-0174]|uniref:D-aminoacyl-tRNA deacylase n=1 Tax=Hydrogenophaga sp. 5NK40-0174 TaxID=3127649 RepID=UPI0031058377
MLALLQRVKSAKVVIGGEVAGAIDQGILLFLCAEPEDTSVTAGKLLTKVLRMRIFGDEQGKMNRSVQDVGGGLLVVSQFTLAADTRSGTRPGFSRAAAPALGEALYDEFVAAARLAHPVVATGRFGADMQVELVNDGPVTIPMSVMA